MTKHNTDVKSLAHTKWNCKYHVVFAPKYRRKVFYQEKREDIRDILRTLCEWKGVEIIEGEFWCKGYYVDTVGKNTAAIKNYIADQLKKDQEYGQLSLFDPRDPFTGGK